MSSSRPFRDPRSRAAVPTDAPAHDGTRALGLVLALVGLVATVAGAGSAPVAGAGRAGEDPATSPAAASLAGARGDARVRAFMQAYAAVIDSVTFVEDDAVFAMRGREIHFRDGRMVDGDRLDRADDCDPIFYDYPLGALTRALPIEDRPTYCTDWQESLFGRTESEIREHGRSTRFLDHRLFVNELLVGPLAEVERDLRAAARSDAAVRRWIDQLRVTYSFIDREIAGSENRSQHAWGFAVDFMPITYDGKAVYWRWSRALDRQGWSRIPLERRWSPPQRVIEIFEEHGFVWGGKWGYFDNMHFEYRPAILLYARLLAG